MMANGAGVLDVDPRLVGRPPVFDGSEAAWQDWSFQTRAYLEVVDPHVAEALELIDNLAPADEVPFAQLNDGNKAAARKVYYILTQLLKGPALLELRRVERGNGLACWHLLQMRYERGTTSRLAATLQGILRPVKFPEDSLGFENALKDWELTVNRWESMAGEKLNDQVKRQILQEQAPHGIRMQLLLQTFLDYDDMRTTVLNFVVTSRDWAKTLGKPPNPHAMDVDAISKGGKGAKGKMKDKGKAKEKAEETRECWVCGKMGHLSTECWYREGAATTPRKSPKGKGKGKYKNVHEVQTGDDAASYVSSAGPSASTASTTRQPPQPPGLQAHIGALGPPELDAHCTGEWICGVTWETPAKQEYCTTGKGGTSMWIMVDSGAACHVCPRDWMPQADTCAQAGLDLKTVSGERMQHYGSRTVQMKFDGGDGHSAATFEVTDVKYPILSVGALVRSGHALILSPENPYLLRPTGEPLYLEMRNGLPYVQVNVVESEKKASQPGTPRRTGIREVRFEPTIQEINEGYERELKSNAESCGWITTEGYEQDLQGDAESYEDHEQEPITSASMPTGEAAFALPSRTGPAPPMGAPSATAVPSAAHAPEPPTVEPSAAEATSSSAAPALPNTVRSGRAPLLSNAGGPPTVLRSTARGHAVCHQRVGQRRAGPDAGQPECVEEVHPLPSQQHGLRVALDPQRAPTPGRLRRQ